ncbi:MAG: RNA polymerase sigma factor [Clostridia bacterium]|nr:RNA polymerase sigma factor [Clostridia bacterium]
MDSFETIYQEYFPRVYAFLYRLCRDRDTAEELTQETFLQVFTSFHRFRGDSELFTWLASIAKHVFYAYLRKNRLQLEAINLDLVTDAICTEDSSNPEIIAERHAVQESVRRVLRKLPEKHRDVVMLRMYADLPFEEIAAALKISENSAKVIYHRAKKLLMEEIKDEYKL